MIKRVAKNDLNAAGAFITFSGIALLAGRVFGPDIHADIVFGFGIAMLAIGPAMLFKKEDMTEKQQKYLIYSVMALALLMFLGIVLFWVRSVR